MMPLQPEQPIAVTLQAQQWNVVLEALSNAPYRVAAPVIQAVMAQIQPDGGLPPDAAKPNGAEHVSH